MTARRPVLVTGGAGYIGSRLVPALLDDGYDVVVVDALWFGPGGLRDVAAHARLRLIPADIRDAGAMRAVLERHAPCAVVHLAAISNDPSSALDATATRAVNLEATRALAEMARDHGVERFIFASSASVYGERRGRDVTEASPPAPITLYAECKALAEQEIFAIAADRFAPVAVRAGSVGGWSPRLRLDLVVNILASQALAGGPMTVHGGDQWRAHVHIDDAVDFYRMLLRAPRERIGARAFNVVAENATVRDVAERVRRRLGSHVRIEVVDAVDRRSYHLSGARAARVLGWRPKRTLDDAIDDLARAWRAGRIVDPGAPLYRNVAWMKAFPMIWRR